MVTQRSTSIIIYITKNIKIRGNIKQRLRKEKNGQEVSKKVKVRLHKSSGLAAKMKNRI